MLGHSVYVGHLQDTQYLSDNVPEEREAGIRNGLSFLSACDAAIFFNDLGLSDGMKLEMAHCSKKNISYVICSLDDLNTSIEELTNDPAKV